MSRSDPQAPPVDLWARVGFDHLPPSLVAAFEQEDWPKVRDELRKVMDGVTTDGAYGRELLQLVLGLPIGFDPLFDRYRAMTSVDFGDWEGLQRCVADGHPTDPTEILGRPATAASSPGGTRSALELRSSSRSRPIRLG